MTVAARVMGCEPRSITADLGPRLSGPKRKDATMSTGDGYNGWSNYETWCVSLWLSNDQGLYSVTQELAHDYAYVSDETEEGDAGAVEAAYQLGRALKALVEEFPEVEAVQSQASFVADLFGAAFGEVDWYEIAENLLSEIEVDA